METHGRTAFHDGELARKERWARMVGTIAFLAIGRRTTRWKRMVGAIGTPTSGSGNKYGAVGVGLLTLPASGSGKKMNTHARNDCIVGKRGRNKRWKRKVGPLVMTASGSGKNDDNAWSEASHFWRVGEGCLAWQQAGQEKKMETHARNDCIVGERARKKGGNAWSDRLP